MVFLKNIIPTITRTFFLRFQIYSKCDTTRKVFHLLSITMFGTLAIVVDSSLFVDHYHVSLRIWHVLHLVLLSSCCPFSKILSYFVVPPHSRRSSSRNSFLDFISLGRSLAMQQICCDLYFRRQGEFGLKGGRGVIKSPRERAERCGFGRLVWDRSSGFIEFQMESRTARVRHENVASGNSDAVSEGC